ncbi:helix-hairpin-helix domain-containing protein [Microbulbifer thermotolerans]|uniref:Helix-hairpin-helix domain-containing protein n=1 Tax=Microbulbifer thermotolerans TaxID=252514 RepID=A0AB35HXW5_MICTH|nr:ComEA family DNA-binding protein [Microbulbifer thermotolerans]MCX2796263.1 helix-hairpin-helix domain-containing protein [Microbulbifer thermotolerans]MCX2802080.1 helix-hairpin-helix domain-containing protein [Microbulbifer thermotolerans]
MKTIRAYCTAIFAALYLLWAPAATLAADEHGVVSVNINTATAEELAEKLDGIGQSKAELIIQFRDQHGPFTSLEQLLEIKGIGQATLDKNRDKIQL